MSHYSEISVDIKDNQCLIETLMEIFNISKDNIEVHQSPVNLYDMVGSMRPQQAHIIVRRQYVGIAANDMGFLKMADGTFKIIVDQYSQTTLGYNQKWLKKLKQNYTTRVATKTLQKNGNKVTQEKLPNGMIKLSVKVRD